MTIPQVRSRLVLNLGSDISIADETNQSQDFDRLTILKELKDILKPVDAAAYNSYDNAKRSRCFEGTRVKLLGDIKRWVEGETGSQSIYVLYGIAGIGKSTIAKTLAEYSAQSKYLAASFFFSRDEEGRRTPRGFFPTLAYQLACNETFTCYVREALQQDPDAPHRAIQMQFDSLIAQPLKRAAFRREKPLLIVVDALDECDDDSASILTILAHNIPKIPHLKVFITTRPELHIQIALDQYHDYEQFHMQDIEHSVVEADIKLYLEFRLSPAEVRKAFFRLRPPLWELTEKQMILLVGVSGKLFIVASTAADFILDPKRAAPAKRIAALLDGVSPNDFSGSKYAIMDDVYTRIIRAAQPDPIDDWFDQFRAFVGTIILLQDPLPCDTLAALLGVDVNEIIGTLSNLHSLLAPSEKARFIGCIINRCPTSYVTILAAQTSTSTVCHIT